MRPEVQRALATVAGCDPGSLCRDCLRVTVEAMGFNQSWWDADAEWFDILIERGALPEPTCSPGGIQFFDGIDWDVLYNYLAAHDAERRLRAT